MTHMGSTNSKKKKNNKLTYNQDPSNIYIYIYIYIRICFPLRLITYDFFRLLQK